MKTELQKQLQSVFDQADALKAKVSAEKRLPTDEERDQLIDERPRNPNEQKARNGPPDPVAGYRALSEDLL